MASFKFIIEVKGKELHKLFEGSLAVEDGVDDAVLVTLGVLAEMVKKGHSTGSTRINMTLKKEKKGKG